MKEKMQDSFSYLPLWILPIFLSVITSVSHISEGLQSGNLYWSGAFICLGMIIAFTLVKYVAHAINNMDQENLNDPSLLSDEDKNNTIQILKQVVDSIEQLENEIKPPEFTEKNSNVVVPKWLEKMKTSYTTHEQRSNHTGQTESSSNDDDLVFF